ncbi:hypothetical protein QSV08_04730 [Maribacter sp. BPC-D8]|uniref:hypothetical protein n=1 Tax=Maribacter sp. BPC-D8 TaxID=3053613 RepID=UPI002B486891|nr:hypothetical protein [Maribacter sp. BPC-D8]WRI30547.1 hypothetical protein QSV08_04730 [Maribacter sp. BPC-D8]
MDTLLPILKTSDYRKDEKLQFKEFLFNDAIAPVVAYGKDSGNAMVYEGAADESDLYARFPDIKKEALANLKAIDVPYQITEAEGTNVLFAEGHEYASEKILDKAYMIKIAADLKCDTLMVGIPFKGVLMAIDSNSDMRLKLPVIVKQYFENPQQDPISDKVFLVQNGEVVAMGGEKLPENESDDNFVISENKAQNYGIELKSKNVEELVADVNTSFKQVMLMILQRKSFGGEITFKLSSAIPLDQALINKCNSIIEQIEKNEMLQTISQALASSKVQFKFLHDGNLIAPTTASKIAQSESIQESKPAAPKLEQETKKVIADTSEKIKTVADKKQKLGITKKSKPWWKFWASEEQDSPEMIKAAEEKAKLDELKSSTQKDFDKSDHNKFMPK